MNDKLFRLNRILVICDFFVTCITVSAFALGAWYFAKWWIALFALIPLGMYTTHGIVIDSDLNHAKEDGGDTDG